MRNYYAEEAIWGWSGTRMIRFDSKKERDEFVRTTDFTNAITAKEVAEREKRGDKAFTIKQYEMMEGWV